MEVLQTVFQCRELAAALERLPAPELLDKLRLELSDDRLQLPSDDDVSSDLATVVSLVLKDVEHAATSFLTAPSVAGSEALRALQRAVYGSAAAQHSLMQSVFCGSLAQASRTLQLCAAALLDALAPHNCFGIYSVAQCCKATALVEAARDFCLRNFAAAAQLDYAGLATLPPASLMAFLCSDELQVASELDVFSALVTWVEHDAAARMPGFARRLAAAVRLPLLDMQDLAFIDAHPLVAKNKTALQLVAHAYLGKLTDMACDTPLGLSTCSRPRRALPQGQLQPTAASALTELVQSLAAAQAAPAACSPQPVLLLGAPTPGLRAGLQTLRGVAQPPCRALDMVGALSSGQLRACAGMGAVPGGLASRRALLFSALDGCNASPSPCSRSVGGRAEADVATAKCLSMSQHEVHGRQHTAPARVGGLGVEMMLSPTKPGIRQWLDGMTAPPAQQQWAAWPSRKRLRYDD